MIYDILVARLNQPNESAIITWTEWQNILGFDIRRTRSALRRAAEELLHKHSRTLESVRGEGYRIDIPSNRLALVREQEHRGMSSFGRAQDLATHVPHDLLTTEQQAQLELQNRHLAQINAMLSRHDRRIVHTEERVDRVDERVSGLEDRLKSLGVLPRDAETVEGEIIDETVEQT